ncbi:kelch-like protein 40 [Physella acuta]|uniref:kelch-like protein 40 n=1 Tax=Physella acuta TaxID=109671 RepID=UPI0027DD02FD|nr:kelch-like protein 40 [Physella acuta]
MDIAKDIFKCFQSNMETFPDFTVIVSDFQFNCHRFVLSSCSGFFEALMRTDMKEKAESICTLKDISPETFGLILDVLYKGKNVLNKENMLELWKAANQLQINLLITACKKCVKKNITIENCINVLKTAELLQSLSVIAKVKNVMVTSYFDLVYSDNFKQVSLDELVEILQNDQLKVCPDFCVTSVMMWASAEDYSHLPPIKSIDEFCQRKWTQNSTYNYIKDSGSATYRRSRLDKLLSVIQLQWASKECLSMLMSNEFIIGNKNAIYLVNRIAAARLDGVDEVKQPHRVGMSYKKCQHCSTKHNGYTDAFYGYSTYECNDSEWLLIN